MPRSSSGEFHAHLMPWVAVNAPPKGGPTSSPKTSVRSCRSSATWRAMRMAWTMLDMRYPPLTRSRSLKTCW